MKDVETDLKHILKQEYVIKCKVNGEDRYLTTIYATSTNESSNIDNAMKIKNLESAKALLQVAKEIDNSSSFRDSGKIISITVMVETIKDEED